MVWVQNSRIPNFLARVFAFITGCAVLCVFLALFVTWWMKQPERFLVTSAADRNRIISACDSAIAYYLRARGEAALRFPDNQYLVESYANDPDLGFPLDRAIIVKSIQEYVLCHGTLPDSLDNLTASGLLTSSSLSYWHYSLSRQGEQWQLSTNNSGQVLATGN